MLCGAEEPLTSCQVWSSQSIGGAILHDPLADPGAMDMHLVSFALHVLLLCVTVC